MKYFRNISIKSLGIGILIGYIVPMLIIKTLVYVLYEAGYTNIFGFFGLLILITPVIVSPLIASYLGAKYAKASPILNGLLSVILGIAFISTTGQFNGAIIYAVFVITSLGLAFVVSRRFVVHG